MKLIPIDYENLPKNTVLAYNGIHLPKIGILLRDDETTVLCSTDSGNMYNVTHYIPLDQVKPESEEAIKEVQFFISMTNGANQRSRYSWFTIGNNESLSNEFYKWVNNMRKEFAADTNTPIDAIVTLALNCIQF